MNTLMRIFYQKDKEYRNRVADAFKMFDNFYYENLKDYENNKSSPRLIRKAKDLLIRMLQNNLIGEINVALEVNNILNIQTVDLTLQRLVYLHYFELTSTSDFLTLSELKTAFEIGVNRDFIINSMYSTIQENMTNKHEALRLLKLYINNGISQNIIINEIPLIHLCLSKLDIICDDEYIRFLISCDVDLDIRDKNGNTPLLFCVLNFINNRNEWIHKGSFKIIRCYQNVINVLMRLSNSTIENDSKQSFSSICHFYFKLVL